MFFKKGKKNFLFNGIIILYGNDNKFLYIKNMVIFWEMLNIKIKIKLKMLVIVIVGGCFILFSIVL